MVFWTLGQRSDRRAVVCCCLPLPPPPVGFYSTAAIGPGQLPLPPPPCPTEQCGVGTVVKVEENLIGFISVLNLSGGHPGDFVGQITAYLSAIAARGDSADPDGKVRGFFFFFFFFFFFAPR